jgi:hypothetical protein
MNKMQLIKMINELSFCIGRLEGYHEGLIITNQKLNGMDLLLNVATVISDNVDVLEDWFKKEFPE